MPAGPGDPRGGDSAFDADSVSATRPRASGNGPGAIAGATLVFDARAALPDLVLAMQYLVDDLRAEGRAIGAIKLTGSTLRLRADPYEMILTRAADPLPARALQGLLRPPRGETPDFARVHLARALRLHRGAMGFLIRRRGALPTDLADAARLLAAEGRFLLLPVIEAAQPALVIWQPGGLVLGTEEFRRAPLATLLEPGDPLAPLTIAPPERLALPRPGERAPPDCAADDPGASPPPALRAERYAKRSLGRFFGGTPERPVILPRIERESERLATALREASPPRTPRRRWFADAGKPGQGRGDA
ncbi:hypothetical protein [Pararhodobacter marinus]|uniref:hypothetical protein n=1 Tax=Pararhodobacter marinus TaxID=2184063 RepID=UPI0035196134